MSFPIELVDAEGFLNMLGIAQTNIFELSHESVVSYMLSKGVHVGTGVHKEFVSGEDLRERPVVIWSIARSDLIDLDEDQI